MALSSRPMPKVRIPLNCDVQTAIRNVRLTCAP